MNNVPGTLIRKLRTDLKMTMKELGEKVGLTESAIGMIERGERNPSFDKLPLIANALKTEPSFLMGWSDNSVFENDLKEAKDYFYNEKGFRSDDDLMESLSDYDLISLYGLLKLGPDLSKEEISMRFYGDYMDQTTGEILTSKSLILKKLKLYDNPVSAGRGAWLDDGCEYSFEEIDKPPVDADFALRVRGDSMSPLYNDDDVVFVKSNVLVEPGQVGVFLLNSEGYLKQWQGNKLVSLNSEYDPIFITDEDEFRVIGKVVRKR